MRNKILANDWLEDGKKHLDVACTMQKDSYYNDIVGLELQQAIERFLKSVLAFNNKKIIRTDLAVLLKKQSLTYHLIWRSYIFVGLKPIII